MARTKKKPYEAKGFESRNRGRVFVNQRGKNQADTSAKDVAINTLRKYQKIEEAYTKYLNDVVTNIYADKKFVEALEGIFENEDNN